MTKFAHSKRTTRCSFPVQRLTGMAGVFVAGTLLLLLSLGAVPNAGASSNTTAFSGVTITGQINGQELATSSQSNPVRLYPLRPTNIRLTVANGTASTVHVAAVRLSGQVVDLTFFAFDTTVAFSVGPGRTVTNFYSLPLIGLSGQATGLVDGSLSVLNSRQQVVSSQGFVADVRGSLNSVYGIFGIILAVLTAIALGGVLVSLARRRLARNRFRRGLTFLVPGIGVGLILVFTLSATRVFVPSPSHWIPLVIVSAASFFVIGYFTPGSEADDEDENEDERELASVESPGDPVTSGMAGSTLARQRGVTQTPIGGDRAAQRTTVVPVPGPPPAPSTAQSVPSPPTGMGTEAKKPAGGNSTDTADLRHHPTVSAEPDSLADGGVSLD